MNFASAPQGHPILDETLTKWRPFQIGPGPEHLSGHKKEGGKLSAPAETTPEKLLLQNAVQASVSASVAELVSESESETKASCNNENKEL